MSKPKCGENKRLHIKILEDTINRMSNISFIIKGWTMTFIGILITIASKQNNIILLLISIIFTVILWRLDGFYLKKERFYRKCYETVIEMDEKDINFKMSPSKKELEGSNSDFRNAMLSQTLIPFYGTILTTLVIYFLVWGFFLYISYFG